MLKLSLKQGQYVNIGDNIRVVYVGGSGNHARLLIDAPREIVDIGDVAHIGHVEATGAQPALNHVENHQHAGMSEMAVVVNRHAANVHADLARFDRNKILLFPDQGVVDFQHCRAR